LTIELVNSNMPAIKSLQPKPLSAEIWNTWPLYLIALIILVLTAARSSADNKSILWFTRWGAWDWARDERDGRYWFARYAKCG
jgi:hypothetical protein